MEVTPDLDGFREAMAQQREHFGVDVDFFLPGAAPVWPAGTAIDPETDEPFDPAIEPTSGGDETVVTLKVNVFTGLRVPGSDETIVNGTGAFEMGEATLDLSLAQAAQVQTATAVVLYGERHDITERETAGIGNQPHRALIYVRQA